MQELCQDKWNKACRLCLTRLPGSLADFEATQAASMRQKAADRGLSTKMLGAEWEAIARHMSKPETSWATFHRNPYCWHELLNYLDVDNVARGWLYGLANLNATGWQKSSFVLLKLIDVKREEEEATRDGSALWQRWPRNQEVRTPSKRVIH